MKVRDAIALLQKQADLDVELVVCDDVGDFRPATELTYLKNNTPVSSAVFYGEYDAVTFSDEGSAI